ncbi:MAG: glycogen-binding domain-containing protein [Candidatus Margulisbacteria bacterium]|nr:glycogen-binding domain-containing protein [Candidatus Margulisiibacteriota bacterium]MBU1617023.1 glycogen-binding domain-containing protein [Candidatus Margulisiibacteriota bacterium]MBU1867755.1 glycogen-binding domain-containing protein [Candidatus Margulisiibacteriota bacterium]
MAKKKVVFSFKAPVSANDVRICGEFSNWEKGAIFMSEGKAGEWKATVNLEPGEYQYKYWADGQWFLDPQTARVNNGLGGENSIRSVR